jgi:hypothetical protein
MILKKKEHAMALCGAEAEWRGKLKDGNGRVA